MFDLLSRNQWINMSICFVVGLFMLFNYSQGNPIQNYIAIPIEIIGSIALYFTLKDNVKSNDKPKLEKVE